MKLICTGFFFFGVNQYTISQKLFPRYFNYFLVLPFPPNQCWQVRIFGWVLKYSTLFPFCSLCNLQHSLDYSLLLLQLESHNVDKTLEINHPPNHVDRWDPPESKAFADALPLVHGEWKWASLGSVACTTVNPKSNCKNTLRPAHKQGGVH